MIMIFKISLNHNYHQNQCLISFNLKLTANLCASSSSAAAICSTAGPTRCKPSRVNCWNVIFLTNESRETPLYAFAKPLVGRV